MSQLLQFKSSAIPFCNSRERWVLKRNVTIRIQKSTPGTSTTSLWHGGGSSSFMIGCTMLQAKGLDWRCLPSWSGRIQFVNGSPTFFTCPRQWPLHHWCCRHLICGSQYQQSFQKGIWNALMSGVTPIKTCNGTAPPMDLGENWIIIDVDLIVLLYYHTPPCDHNHVSCDARTPPMDMFKRLLWTSAICSAQ
jgi:hypothetical protein